MLKSLAASLGYVPREELTAAQEALEEALRANAAHAEKIELLNTLLHEASLDIAGLERKLSTFDESVALANERLHRVTARIPSMIGA